MSTPLHVDVAAVDRTQFKVFEEDGETLVIPRKDKFRWDEAELHLRSLVLDAHGHVVSAGFPKFFNLGENPAHDHSLSRAMAGGTVEFPEKIDGSLIVADRIRGVARLRTRGRRDLPGSRYHAARARRRRSAGGRKDASPQAGSHRTSAR